MAAYYFRTSDSPVHPYILWVYAPLDGVDRVVSVHKRTCVVKSTGWKSWDEIGAMCDHTNGAVLRRKPVNPKLAKRCLKLAREFCESNSLAD